MNNPTINSITDDYVISVDINNMQYETISQNSFFGVPSTGKYSELIHRFVVNFVYSEDRDIFTNIFSADGVKKASEENIKIISEEIRFCADEKIYYKNINAVIYNGRNTEHSEIIISFFDITEKKKLSVNEYSVTPKKDFRKTHNLILNVNLEKNTYNIAVSNGSIIPGSKTGVYTKFIEQFVTLIDDEKKKYIYEQCQPDFLLKTFSSQNSEIYFKFKVRKNYNEFVWISLCVVASPDFKSSSSVFIIIKYIDSNETPEKNITADVVIDSRFDIFASRCLSILNAESSDTEKSVNEILKTICGFLQADSILVFTPTEVFPTVMRPAYLYTENKQEFKGTGMLSGLSYAVEIQKLNNEIDNKHFMVSDIDGIAEDYPNIYKYLKNNDVRNVSIARINFGIDNKAILCIENFKIDTGEMQNSTALSCIFLGLAMDRVSLFKNYKNMNSMYQRQNELLSLVYNRMHNAIVQFEVNIETNEIKLINFNDAFCSIVSCDKEYLMKNFSADFFRFAVDDDKEKLIYALSIIVSYQRDNSQTEIKIMDKNGDIKWIHVNMFRIQSDNNKKVMIQSEFTDVTNLKHEQIEKGMFDDATAGGGTIKFIVKEDSFELISVNDKFYKFFEISNFEEWMEIVGKEKYDKFIEEYFDIFTKREAFKKNINVTLKSGEVKWIMMSAECIGIKAGYPLYMMLIVDMTEIETVNTELERMNMELKIRTQRYKLIEEITNEKMIDYEIAADRMTIQKKLNSSTDNDMIFENYFGNDFDGCFKDYIYPDDLDYYIKSVKKILNETGKGSFDYRSRLYDNDDEYKWYRIFCTSITDNNDNIVKFIARVQNIENEKKKQHKMEIQIKSDPMTGLFNKVAARSEIMKIIEMDSESRHAMLVIDVDNFKAVNDNLGHMFGDAVLKNIASAIKRTFRSSDIIGRIGGDEFIVLMKCVDEDIVEKKADELCKSIKRVYNSQDKNIEVSCSIGIAYSDFTDCNYDTLFNMADKAVYSSKTNGKGRYTVYSDNMTESNHIITRDESVNVHQVSSGKLDMDIISFALSLLSNSKDIDSSISILLEQISNRYDITNIVVFEEDKKGSIFSSNVWPENYTMSSDNDFFRFDSNSSFDIRTNNVLCIDDCSEHKEPLPLTMKDIKSYILISAGDNSTSGIMIAFGDNRSKRCWEINQKNTLVEVAKIISIFITLRNERDADKRKIEKLRSTDALTGLYNFEEFKHKSTEIIKQNNRRKKYAICYMDVNGFLYVNENFGYNAGDKMLSDLANCIRQADSDEKFKGCGCRVYSDYFIVLVSAESRSSIMDKIKEANDMFFEMQRKNYPAGSIGLSTGIYFIDDNFCDISIAIDNADLARKKAKRTNQNTYEIYTDELRTIRSNELSIIGDLYRAMEKGRIELFLQPKFHLVTRKVIGAEALARWRNEDCSLKYPSEFVPALEKIGYIVKLDFYMYEKVLETMRKWKNMGIELFPISVNFSRKNSMEDGFYERVYELAEAYGIDRQYIEIETTESTFIVDEKGMMETMGRFRNAGFKVDIDDFGTGYSSLSMLVTAPVDVVKIDKSFLKNIEDSQCEREYVKQMCKMISTAKKDIVFEGVETEEQAQFLLECGFTKAQGYLFDKPIHVSEYEEKYLNIKNK